MNTNAKYCDDADCEYFDGNDCSLGFDIKFRLPKGYQDIITARNWGYVRPKECKELMKLKENRVKTPISCFIDSG